MHRRPNYNFKTKEKKQQQKQITNNEAEQYFLKMTNNKISHRVQKSSFDKHQLL